VLTDRGLFHVRSVGFLSDGLTSGPAGQPTGRRTGLVRSDSRGRYRDQRPLQPTTFGVAVDDAIIAEIREIQTPDGYSDPGPTRYQLVVSASD